MNRRVARASATRVDWMRPLRYLWRAPLFVLHAFIALPITLAIIRYGKNRRDRDGRRLDHAAMAWWAAGTVRLCGLRSRTVGAPLPHPVLLVANHVSWLDIMVIHSQVGAGFVAKAEIARWPLVGYMAKAGESVFHRRGSGSSQQAVVEALTERLQVGGSVAIFPEGRTGPGVPVLPFHGRLLAAAVASGTPIQPVAIRYERAGRYHRTIAFRPGEPFLVNFLRILGGPPATVEIHFLAPIEPEGVGRRDIAQQARAAVVEIVERDA